jgi:hypothetical protein
MANDGEIIQPADFERAMDGLLNDFLHASREKQDEAIKAGADVAIEKLAAASPRESGEFANSWKAVKRGNKMYVGNDKKVPLGEGQGKDVPLANILEFSKGAHAKPFIRKTFDGAQNEIYSAIKNKLDGG